VKRPRLKFPIELDIAGERMTFVGCDMLTGWFFQGFPDPMPLTECWHKEGDPEKQQLVQGMDQWHNDILCRGVWLIDERAEEEQAARAQGAEVRPVCRRLTPELVQRLGDQRDRAVLAYFSGIGWIRPENPGYIPPSGTLPRRLPPLDDPFAALEQRTAMTRIPSKNVLLHIKHLAGAAGTAAHAIWRRWWISEFLWTWRAAELERSERAKAGVGSRNGGGGGRTLPEDWAHIGVEA
jgi:hypothetical protein